MTLIMSARSSPSLGTHNLPIEHYKDSLKKGYDFERLCDDSLPSSGLPRTGSSVDNFKGYLHALVVLQILARLLRSSSIAPQNNVCTAFNVVHLIRRLTLHGTGDLTIALTILM